MYKVTCVGLFLLASSFFLSSYCAQKAACESIKTYNEAHFNSEHKPTILWDIHGVIVERDRGAQLQELRAFDKKWELAKQISFGLGKDMIYELYRLFSSGSTGEAFVAIALKHKNKALAELIMKLSNCQTLIPETAALIQELNRRGYRQHIGSNIGVNMFRYLCAKPTMRDIFNTHIFDFSASQLVTYDPDNVAGALKKPDSLFFINYLTKNGFAADTIVFIDDKGENVLAAQQCGMYALMFCDAHQLKSQLWQLLGLNKSSY